MSGVPKRAMTPRSPKESAATSALARPIGRRSNGQSTSRQRLQPAIPRLAPAGRGVKRPPRRRRPDAQDIGQSHESVDQGDEAEPESEAVRQAATAARTGPRRAPEARRPARRGDRSMAPQAPRAIAPQAAAPRLVRSRPQPAAAARSRPPATAMPAAARHATALQAARTEAREPGEAGDQHGRTRQHDDRARPASSTPASTMLPPQPGDIGSSAEAAASPAPAGVGGSGAGRRASRQPQIASCSSASTDRPRRVEIEAERPDRWRPRWCVRPVRRRASARRRSWRSRA